MYANNLKSNIILLFKSEGLIPRYLQRNNL